MTGDYAPINDLLSSLAKEHRALALISAAAGGAPQQVPAAERGLRMQKEAGASA